MKKNKKTTAQKSAIKPPKKGRVKWYLLECEIVGGEIASNGENFVVVRPSQVCPRSEWIGLKKDYGILWEEKKPSEFNAKISKTTVIIELDEEKTTMLRVGDNVCLDDLMRRRYSRVVLELDNRLKTIVGFKAQF